MQKASGAEREGSEASELEKGTRALWVGRLEDVPRSKPSTGVHSYAVVMLITRGQARMKHGIELELRAGDVHLIPPGDVHGGAQFQNAEGWFVGFRPDAFPAEGSDWSGEGHLQLGPFKRIRGGCHPVLQPTPAQRRRIEQWIRALQAELATSKKRQEEAAAALLRLLLIELDRVDVPAAVVETPGLGLARRALAFVETHCLERISLTDVATEVGRSAPHVASTVRRETGRTVGDWIVEFRMAEARRRLQGTDEHVDIIAERVGYADVTHFTRMFKRAHGMTPAAWRRSNGRR